MSDLDREGLLALTPDIYLEDGWLDDGGMPNPRLRTDFAAAAVAQLHAAEVAPQELGFVAAGIEDLLERQADGDAGERLWACTGEAAATVATMIQQPTNPGLHRWLYACAGQVETDEELDAFLGHLDAVNQIYAQSELIAPNGEE